jgi:hypothetical protein
VADGVPDGLRIASLRRRHLATLVDVGVPLSGFFLSLAAMFGGAILRRRKDDESPEDDQCATGESVWERRLASRQWRLGMNVVFAGSAVLLRNSRGVGARVAKIRRVDARTGGPVTVRSALIHYGVNQGWNWLNQRIIRSERRSAAVTAELEQIRDAHRDDPEGRIHAQMKLYKERKMSPFRSCTWQLPGLVARELVILGTPRHQSLPELIAGIITVES